MGWQVKVTFDAQGEQTHVGFVDPLAAAEEQRVRYRAKQGPARVLFTDDGTGWARVAATLFQSMVHPELAEGITRPTSGGDPRMKELCRDVGLVLAADAPSDVKSFHSVVHVSETLLWAADRTQWAAPSPASLNRDQLAQARDALRRRVWTLVAQQGWYRLQPGRCALPRARVDARISHS